MLGSSELLRKKICVTVFLDELFEELEEQTHGDSRPKSQRAESGVIIAEEPPEEKVSTFVCDTDTSSDCNGDRRRSHRRKLKHRSKFGKSKSSDESQNEINSEGEPSMRKTSTSTVVIKVSAPIMTEESFLQKGVNQMVDEEVDCARELLLTKSTQFDSPSDQKKVEVMLENKEQQTEEKYLPSSSSTNRLEDSKALHDLKSILENYVKLKKCSTSGMVSGLLKHEVLSSSEKINNLSAQVLIRDWSSCKKIWNESFESEMSEVECTLKHNSLEYATDSAIKVEKNQNYAQVISYANSDTKITNLMRKTEECTPETRSAVLEAPEETRAVEQTKFRVSVEPSNQFECKSKNFAEGDTNEELSYVFQFESKENLIVYNKALNQEANEVIMGKTKIQFLNPEKPQQFAEVFVQKNSGTSDTESEMVFADSSNEGEIQVFEFEDTVSKTRFLKRMKTVEILGGSSTNDMKNISTELILICEDIDKENICVESWKGSVKSLAELKELYLKDSKESTMYLIEVPLRFIKSTRNGSVMVENKSESE